SLQKDECITCLQWGNEDQTEVLIGRKNQQNLVDIKSLQKDECITCLQWGNEDQTEVLIGRKNQQVHHIELNYASRTLLTSSLCKRMSASHACSGATRIKLRFLSAGRINSADFAPGHVVGLGRCKRKLLAATSSGVVRIWSKKEECVVQTGGKLDVMKVFDEDPTLFATVGFGRGQLHQVDLRAGKPDKGYKGSVGAVTAIATCRRDRLVVSASLDRHLRIHEQASKQLVYKAGGERQPRQAPAHPRARQQAARVQGEGR
ncbi:WD-repeat protein, partial [Operophtera brumata]